MAINLSYDSQSSDAGVSRASPELLTPITRPQQVTPNSNAQRSLGIEFASEPQLYQGFRSITQAEQNGARGDFVGALTQRSASVSPEVTVVPGTQMSQTLESRIDIAQLLRSFASTARHHEGQSRIEVGNLDGPVVYNYTPRTKIDESETENNTEDVVGMSSAGPDVGVGEEIHEYQEGCDESEVS